MLIINTPAEAEKFVRRQQRLRVEAGSSDRVRWDGWDMVFFRAAPEAVYSKDGVYDRATGSFGFDNRSVLEDDGTWRVDYRNVRRSKHPRS